jgi:hypothetical protein
MWRRILLTSSILLLALPLGCRTGARRSDDPPLSWAASRFVPPELPTSNQGGPERIFESTLPLTFTLEADFHQLRRDRSQESEERPGRLTLGDANGGESLPVDIRTRGFFRLQSQICRFPPLRLDFPKDSLGGSALEGLNKIKLVTHCQDRDDYEQNVLEEYLAYRIYGILTDFSFKVQIALITYQDTGGRDETVTRLAFLIEHEDHVAERMGGEALEPPRASPNNFLPQQAGLVYLFQYLIGNTDWSVVRLHNFKVIRVGRDYIPIPYDFDFSGFVYSSYADPAPKLAGEIDSVRERLYRGFCSEGIDYPALFALFREKREPILGVIRNQPGLTEGNIRDATTYVESFYDIIQNDAEAEERIRDTCRGIGG